MRWQARDGKKKIEGEREGEMPTFGQLDGGGRRRRRKRGDDDAQHHMHAPVSEAATKCLVSRK